jgi:hypothetical protein
MKKRMLVIIGRREDDAVQLRTGYDFRADPPAMEEPMETFKKNCKDFIDEVRVYWNLGKVTPRR